MAYPPAFIYFRFQAIANEFHPQTLDDAAGAGGADLRRGDIQLCR